MERDGAWEGRRGAGDGGGAADGGETGDDATEGDAESGGTDAGGRAGRALDRDWDVDRYEDAHRFVHRYGAEVVDLLDPGPDERVLDLGCGTGHLTSLLAEAAGGAVGVDSSPARLARARRTYPDLPFVGADPRALPFAGAFDAVFSNAVLHRMPAADQGRVADAVRAALAPDGRFVAELGADGNLETVVDALGATLDDRGYDPVDPWYFPSVGEYAVLLEERGFEVLFARVFDRAVEFDGEEALRDWLEAFGGPFLADVPAEERAGVLDDVEERLRPELYREGAWTLDYRRLRLVARRVDRAGRNGD